MFVMDAGRASITTVLLCLQKTTFFGGKQKFKIKQLKLKKFIKYVLQLIITTLNATFEVPSL